MWLSSVSPIFLYEILTSMTLCNCSSAHPRAWRWNSTKACERALQYQVGEKIHGFTVNQVRPVLTLMRACEGLHMHPRSVFIFPPRPGFLLLHSRCSVCVWSLQWKYFPRTGLHPFLELLLILESKPNSLMFLTWQSTQCDTQRLWMTRIHSGRFIIKYVCCKVMQKLSVFEPCGFQNYGKEIMFLYLLMLC